MTEIPTGAAAPPPDDSHPDISRYLQSWEPVIAAVAAACRPGQQASPDLLLGLDRQEQEPDWAALAAVFRRIMAGERDASLLNGLDPVETAIAQETLTRLEQQQ